MSALTGLLMLQGTAVGQDYRFPTSEEDYSTFYPTAWLCRTR